jgi:O-antigen/teichoic acid export membrane protein
MFGGQIASFSVQAIYFVVLARLLGRPQYGILAGAVALVSMFTQYSGMGSGLVFLRYVSQDHSKFKEYWGNILASVGVVGGITVVALYFFAKWAFGETVDGRMLLFLAVGDCICGQVTTSAAQVFQAFEKMRVTAGLNFLTNVLRLALAGGMTVTMHGATATNWALASLCVSFAGAVIAIVKVTQTFGTPTFSLRLLLSRLAEGLVFAVSGSTTTIYNDVDKVMLGHYGMSAANGIYSMAYRVVNICTIPIGSIHSAAFPRFFREGIAGARATSPIALRLLKRSTVLAAIGAVCMYLCAPLLPRLAGHVFGDSTAALRWLCLIPLLRCFHLSAGDALAGAGLQRFRLVSQFLAAIGNFCLNLYLIPKYSWIGAACSSLLTDASLGLMNWTLLYAFFTREKATANARPSKLDALAVP